MSVLLGLRGISGCERDLGGGGEASKLAVMQAVGKRRIGPGENYPKCLFAARSKALAIFRANS